MNTEGLSEVAVKDAHPVVESVAETRRCRSRRRQWWSPKRRPRRQRLPW